LRDKWPAFKLTSTITNLTTKKERQWYARTPAFDMERDGHYLWISDRAVEGLGPLITACGELLPLGYPEFPYQALNVLDIRDAVDLERSLVEWREVAPYGGFYYEPKIYTFIPEALEGATLFKPLQEFADGEILATDAFKDAFEALGLVGFNFQLIWDSENPNYHDERYTPERWAMIRPNKS